MFLLLSVFKLRWLGISQLDISQLTSPSESQSQYRPTRIISGRENCRTLSRCRARYNNGVHFGKGVLKNCNFGDAGKQVQAPKYDVQVGNSAVLRQSPQSRLYPLL